jgi:YidC/Oxa1 family membrane protein insertase
VFAFLDVPVAGAYHLVTWLAILTQPLLGELSTAAAIVLFTAGIRLLLHPLARAAVRGEQARAALAPQAQALRRRYRDDPQRLQQELLALYQASGTTIFAGCLPTLLQLPFFTVMYRLFTSTSVSGTPNPMRGHTLLGAPLGAHLAQAFSPGPFGLTGVVFLGLLAALTLVAWFSARWQARLAGQPETSAVPGAALLRLLPYGTVLAAAVIPLAAGLYLLVSTGWTVAERAALRRGPTAGGGAAAALPR